MDRKARFLERTSIGKLEDCWNWTGPRQRKGLGYGVFGGRRLAHRVSFEFFKSDIPKGMHVLHTCDNPACVNPLHLFVGTHQDNMTDMVKKGRSLLNKQKGQDHRNAKLTERDVLEIRASKETLKTLAARYGVSFGLIAHIKKRRAWAHI